MQKIRAFIKRAFNDKTLAYMAGTGMVLFVVHNPDQPFVDQIMLPNIGLILIYIPMMITLPNITKTDFGKKIVYIPLLVMVACIFISVVLNGQGLHLAWFGLSLFGMYLLARKYGQEIFKPFMWAVVIGTIGMVVTGIINPGVKTGGWISPTNYDMATGLLVFATVVSVVKGQWILTSIAIIGLFLTGADEAIFACAVLALFIVLRRDFSKKLLLPIGTLIILITVTFSAGIMQRLYFPAVEKIATVKEVVEDTPAGEILDNIIPDKVIEYIQPAAIVTNEEGGGKDVMLNEATGKRWIEHWSLSPIRPFGYGYNVNNFYPGIIHNLPLIIVEQIGIIGALAWLFVVGYCLFKTKWRYAWIGLLSLCVFDHFIWTQAAVWFPALVGVSTLSEIKGDKIYKGYCDVGKD